MVRPGRARLAGVLGFFFLTLAVVYAAFVYFYSSYRRQLEEELDQRLIAVASATAAAMNGDTWTGLAAGDSTVLARTREELTEIRTVNRVTDILVFDGDRITVFDLADRYPVGEENPALSVSDLEAVTTALAGLPAATVLYSSQGGYLKSAYAPILESGGAIAGGVGVEASATFFEVLDQVRRTLVVAALLVLVGMVLLASIFARLLASQERLESRLRRTENLAAMGQMAAMLAHEIRNPLGIIRGAAERIGQKFQIEDEEMVRFIPDEVDRLEGILGSYLDFARPVSAAGDITDVGEAMTRTLALVDHELERKGIRVEADIGSGPFPARGDAHQLQQVFLNLLLNARDAMPEGGNLRVRVGHRGAQVEVEVEDTGSGMSEETRRRATEAFYTSKEKGSGLGLAVVERTVTELHGRLKIQSAPGKGTRIELSIPRAAG